MTDCPCHPSFGNVFRFVICHSILAIPSHIGPNARPIDKRPERPPCKRIRRPRVRRRLHHAEDYRAQSTRVAAPNRCWRSAGLNSGVDRLGEHVPALAGDLFSSFFGHLVPNYDSRLRPMKKILVLLFCVCALLGSVRPAEAGNVSWGIPLPFPFLFYKFGCGNCGQTNGNGYSKEGGYANTTVAGFPMRRSCPCIPCWLQYHVEYDCDMRLGQTTSMPGVGGPRD